MPSLQISCAVNGDDGYVRVAASAIEFHGTETEAWAGLAKGDPIFGNTDYNIWLRFPNVTVPQGAQIGSATLRFVGASADVARSLMIYGVAEDDHAAPTSLSTWNADHALHTVAGVNWQYVTSADSVELVSPDITAIVQEIVNRPGFASGQAIGLHLDNIATFVQGLCRLATVEHASYDPPRLDITYSEVTTVTATVAALTTVAPAVDITADALTVVDSAALTSNAPQASTWLFVPAAGNDYSTMTIPWIGSAASGAGQVTISVLARAQTTAARIDQIQVKYKIWAADLAPVLLLADNELSVTAPQATPVIT